MTTDTQNRLPFLLVRAQAWTCALGLQEVAETMRALPLAPVAGAPAFVRGVALVRGEPTPVVSLGALLGGEGGGGRRLVTLRLAQRRLALEVDEVLGVWRLEAGMLQAAPPLLGAGPLQVLGQLDGRLLTALNTARLVPEDVWALLQAPSGAAS